LNEKGFKPGCSVWRRLTAAIGGESAVRMESDDPGLQFETGIEPCKLPETDDGGQLKSSGQPFALKKSRV
jgi:hypothetical protein